MSGTNEFSSEERVIVVMGPTGSGKTTFINCVAKRGDEGIGHDIESFTAHVQPIQVKEPILGRKVVFFDTPGFDDTYRSDTEILTEIAGFLVGRYKNHVRIDTILYLHRIIDKRMTGSLLKNLKIFVSLCGIQAMPTVIIITTMWNEVKEDQGATRENSLMERMWFDMIAKGSRVKRFDGTYESALRILGPSENTSASTPNTPSLDDSPLLSVEMVNKRKKLKATAAGYELNKEIRSLVEQQKAASLKLQGLSRGTTDEARTVLEQELEEINQKMKKAKEQLTLLKRGFLDRIFGSRPETTVPQVGQ